MRKIQPITAWKNGEQLEANLLNAYIINDNLESSCSFYYSLNTGGEGTEAMPLVIGQAVAEGNITMSGEDYLAWDNSNEAAYEYIAEKLNLTLINE
jgi:3-oxoacyl-[acyl-carrier-protein] synthase III